jgi:hypothetical protein
MLIFEYPACIMRILTFSSLLLLSAILVSYVIFDYVPHVMNIVLFPS